MDLAKIIGELKHELQCLDTAIASMEELARIQNIPVIALRQSLPDPEPVVEEPNPGRRRRGRPRKDFPPIAAEPPEPSGGVTPDPPGPNISSES